MRKTRFILGLLVAMLMTLGLVLPAAAEVTPSEVTGDLAPGESMTVTKAVQTPEILPKPDIYFLCDNTGSMGGVIDAMSDNAEAIMTAIAGLAYDPQFGVGHYRDFPVDDITFENQLSITDDTSAVSAAINAWAAYGGSDWPECQLYALTQIADLGVGWRAGSTKIVVWIGDSPGHDPVPAVATGLGYDITEATATAALVAAGIRVIAVSVYSLPDGLDLDPTSIGGDYAWAYGITEDGAAGQASRIAAATGGVALAASSPEEVVEAIMAGLEALPITVGWNVVSCDPGLTVSLTPDTVTVTSGEIADFEEIITATDDAPQCHHQYAKVEFVDERGNVLGTESIDIHILDVTPPTVSSNETCNPAGKKIPPAGSTTLPGPKGGMNEDGFYQLTAVDNCDKNPKIYVTDLNSSAVFGPFSSGTVVKFTEAKGAAPSCKKIGSIIGQAGYVQWHITLPTDAVVVAVDESDNWSFEIQYVPPAPK